MIVMLDNYDSFTYNLVQYLGELGAEVRVLRNDEVAVREQGSDRNRFMLRSRTRLGICVGAATREIMIDLS